MSISSLRRFAVLLAVALVSFLIFACQSMKLRSPDAKPQSRRDILMRQDIFCEESNKSMSRPLICIDDQKGTSVPQSIRIHDVEASPGGYPTKHPVTVHWFTRRSANLQLKYEASDGCRLLTEPDCDGRGHCEARVKVRLEKDAKPQKCTYGILVDELKDPDGDIIIQPCCY